MMCEDPKLTVSDAKRFIKQIKECLTTEKYVEFLVIMKDYLKHRIDITCAKEKVLKLFIGHQELISGLNSYLPEEHKIFLPHKDQSSGVKKQPYFQMAMECVENIKIGLQDDDQLYTSFLGVLDLYRMGKRSVFEVYLEVADLLHDHQDLLKEFTTLLPNNFHETIASGAKKVHPTHDEKGMMKSQDCEQHRPIHKGYARYLEHAVVDQFPQDMHDYVICFREKVKEQLCNPDHYHEFLEFFKHYHSSQLQSLVSDLLGAHPDLMEEFNKLIEHSEKNEGREPEAFTAKHGNTDGDQDKMENDEAFKRKGIRKRSATGIELRLGCKQSQLSSQDKKKAKPFQERCNPSYRFVPRHYFIHEVSQRTELDKQVVNDPWVSIPYVNKDHSSFRKSPKISYLNSRMTAGHDYGIIAAAIKHAEELMWMVNIKSIKTNRQFPIQYYFPSGHLRCIKNLYGAQWHDVEKKISRNVGFCLPVVLGLKQKQEEWRMLSSHINKIWANKGSEINIE